MQYRKLSNNCGNVDVNRVLSRFLNTGDTFFKNEYNTSDYKVIIAVFDKVGLVAGAYYGINLIFKSNASATTVEVIVTGGKFEKLAVGRIADSGMIEQIVSRLNQCGFY